MSGFSSTINEFPLWLEILHFSVYVCIYSLITPPCTKTSRQTHRFHVHRITTWPFFFTTLFPTTEGELTSVTILQLGMSPALGHIKPAYSAQKQANEVAPCFVASKAKCDKVLKFTWLGHFQLPCSAWVTLITWLIPRLWSLLTQQWKHFC